MKYCGKCNRTYGGSQTHCAVDNERLSLKDLYGFVGELIAGKYMVQQLTNIGGMSAVYIAQQIGVDRRVAFKILLPNVAASNANLARLFEREAKTAGRLSHENIATIYDAGHTAEGVPYIVMEWLSGHTLEKEIQSGQPMGFARITHLLRQIASALDVAHAKHIIHRDLKPSNIMLVQRADKRSEGLDHVKIVDFGLAKVGGTQNGDLQVSEAVGTPNYASPEQFQTGADISPSSDIYSLGIMLYQMLTGHLPFRATTIAEAVRAHLLETPQPLSRFRPDLPLAIETVLNRMLAKTPHYRPQSAGEVADIFETALRHMNGETPLSSSNRGFAQPQLALAAQNSNQNVSLGHAANSADDEPSYTLEELFRPLPDTSMDFSFVPRTIDQQDLSLLQDPTSAQSSGDSGQLYTSQPLDQLRFSSNQMRNNPSGQVRGTSSGSLRHNTTVQPLNAPIINPAVGSSLSFKALSNSLPGTRRQQVLAIIAILLSLGLCLALLFTHEKTVTSQVVPSGSLSPAAFTHTGNDTASTRNPSLTLQVRFDCKG